ncbi:hypothetical protein J2S30_004039 [Herbaspirillum rubrisubalbicans]|uniref:hypothetical protein n=1 Tax=Herbaspirillum rubrisubalbicans TaxID=80842 RepID=UPI0020A101F5|nr:hypothetical protein [Herbaspirillum rubrisubalbicans]MCP1575660.1 hypothetical protein [Herbaspirillum rubrisubalbicans]
MSASDDFLITFDAGFVVAVHDELLSTEPGLPGMAGGGIDALESALHRVADRTYYDGLDDIFGIAAMYAIAIARGHLFNDATSEQHWWWRSLISNFRTLLSGVIRSWRRSWCR